MLGREAPQAPKPEHADAQLTFRPLDPLNAPAFDHFYNLDYDRAVAEFQQVLDRHPDDPFAVNHLLTAVLFKELYRMGALDTGDYANDSFVGTAHRPADPKVKQQIKDLVNRAEKLEEKQLAANPNDVDALYARGVTRAQFATYTALIERAWFSALRNAVGARRDHERVLELAPGYTDAKLVVGAHNFVMGSLPWGVKVAAALIGLGGSKEKGIQYLYEAARGTGESSVDAKIVLMLFLRREHRYAEALTLVRSLVPQYPRNVLMALEEGALLRSEGRNPEAAETYRRIWQAGRDGHYPGLHYEMAALSLGNLLRSQKDYAGAATAYEEVNEVEHPDPELLQKANLGAGEMYDLLQRRELAMRKYQAVVAANADTPPAETARKLMKEAYRQQ
ncbi:MAG TPA: tetratricopeptide repeat protein [Terriglobales bacterium]|jgi:tetratricopeptide (TPR) repeat protein|nr:tetratricopeptide repeat protein [Terriglobales bacterium]